MGYVCPVCETPQADGEHLANHLAFTAIMGDDDHESWLDEYAPGWGEEGPADLADRVTPHVEEAEFPQVFEDTTSDHDHSHEPTLEEHIDNQRRHRGPAGAGGRGDLTGEAADVMEEARRLTEQMRRDVAEGEAMRRDAGDGGDEAGATGQGASEDGGGGADGQSATADGQSAADADESAATDGENGPDAESESESE